MCFPGVGTGTWNPTPPKRGPQDWQQTGPGKARGWGRLPGLGEVWTQLGVLGVWSPRGWSTASRGDIQPPAEAEEGEPPDLFDRAATVPEKSKSANFCSQRGISVRFSKSSPESQRTSDPNTFPGQCPLPTARLSRGKPSLSRAWQLAKET